MFIGTFDSELELAFFVLLRHLEHVLVEANLVVIVQVFLAAQDFILGLVKVDVRSISHYRATKKRFLRAVQSYLSLIFIIFPNLLTCI